jgi:hypothetical protein
MFAKVILPFLPVFLSIHIMILFDSIWRPDSQVAFIRKIAFEDIAEEGIVARAWEGLLPNNRILIYCL